jgi:hypothetical protein
MNDTLIKNFEQIVRRYGSIGILDAITINLSNREKKIFSDVSLNLKNSPDKTIIDQISMEIWHAAWVIAVKLGWNSTTEIFNEIVDIKKSRKISHYFEEEVNNEMTINHRANSQLFPQELFGISNNSSNNNFSKDSQTIHHTESDVKIVTDTEISYNETTEEELIRNYKKIKNSNYKAINTLNTSEINKQVKNGRTFVFKGRTLKSFIGIFVISFGFILIILYIFWGAQMNIALIGLGLSIIGCEMFIVGMRFFIVVGSDGVLWRSSIKTYAHLWSNTVLIKGDVKSETLGKKRHVLIKTREGTLLIINVKVSSKEFSSKKNKEYIVYCIMKHCLIALDENVEHYISLGTLI